MADNSKTSLKKAIEDLRQAFALNDINRARQLFNDGCLEHGDNDKLLFEYGNFLYEQGNVTEAKDYIVKSI